VRGKDQRLTAVTGVVGAEAGKSCSSVTVANRGGRWSSEGVNGVPVARVPEGGGEVVKKLLCDDVVLTGCSAEARRWWISGSMAKPSGSGARSSSTLRSGCSGARGRVWMGWGAPAGDGDAVCALDRGWGAVVVAIDGGAERAANWSSPALRETTLRCEKTELGGSMSCRESSVMLQEHWIGVRRWCGELTTVVRGDGGGPVRNLSLGEEKVVEM
jgi:hypothetical protein